MLGIASAKPSSPSAHEPYSRPWLEAHALALSIAAGVCVGQILNASSGASIRIFARG